MTNKTIDCKCVSEISVEGFRGEALGCKNDEAKVNLRYFEGACVATQVYWTGHTRLDSDMDRSKMLNCPYRQ